PRQHARRRRAPGVPVGRPPRPGSTGPDDRDGPGPIPATTTVRSVDQRKVTMTATTNGPLEGVRVLDLTSIVMGPLATQIFGDLGADVITVEDSRGTLSRVMTAGPHPQLSGLALNLLRNQRSVVLDLKTDDGHDAVLRLASTCQVLVTNLRPATLGRL